MPTILMVSVVGLVALVAGFVGLRNWAASAPRPTNLGVDAQGQLSPCPESFNCVSTQQGLPRQLMSPLTYSGSMSEAQARLRALVAAQPRTVIVTERPGYLHVEYRSASIGFIDDVEFAFDDARKVIDFRSASRQGQGDMGVNQARMAEITEVWGK